MKPSFFVFLKKFIPDYLKERNFRVDLILRIGYWRIFREDLFSRILVLSMFYIFWFFVVCSSASSMWVTELLPKFFDFSNTIIWI